MAVLTIQTINEDGINNVSFTAVASGGDTVANDGKTFLFFKNASGGAITVTITAQVTSVDSETFGELTKSNATVSVPALEDSVSGEAFIGGFSMGAFNTDGQISITYSASTNLTVAALRIQ